MPNFGDGGRAIGIPALLASIRSAFPWLRHVFADGGTGPDRRAGTCHDRYAGGQSDTRAHACSDRHAHT